jgi:hypothetical protein
MLRPRPVNVGRLSHMADTSEHDPQVVDYWAETFLYVFWKQATPSTSEIAALHRIDPALIGTSLAEVTATLKDENTWRLGPYLNANEVSALAEQLRTAGLSVEVKRE